MRSTFATNWARSLSGGGLNLERDVAAITVNRWPHGYAYEYNSLAVAQLPMPMRAPTLIQTVPSISPWRAIRELTGATSDPEKAQRQAPQRGWPKTPHIPDRKPKLGLLFFLGNLRP